MRIELTNPATIPAPAGAYSHAAHVELEGGHLLMLSGQIATGSDGEIVGAADMTAQAERVFTLIGNVLESFGASLADVISIRTYLTDMTKLREYGAVRRRYLTATPPTSTTIEVPRLFRPEALLEVEVVAAWEAGNDSSCES
jgi:2-iminobutanoate/2-iminopropanoate deaminase